MGQGGGCGDRGDFSDVTDKTQSRLGVRGEPTDRPGVSGRWILCRPRECGGRDGWRVWVPHVESVRAQLPCPASSLPENPLSLRGYKRPLML